MTNFRLGIIIKPVAIALMLLGSLAVSAQDHYVEIQTSAICEMCQYAIEKEMAYEKGVKNATLDLDSKKLLVYYNPKKTNPETIRTRVTLTGYHADSLRRDPEAYAKLPACCKDGAHQEDEEKQE